MDLLENLSGPVLIPTAVARELREHHGATPSRCGVRSVWRQRQDFTLKAWVQRADGSRIARDPGAAGTLDGLIFGYGQGRDAFGLRQAGGGCHPMLTKVDVGSVAGVDEHDAATRPLERTDHGARAGPLDLLGRPRGGAGRNLVHRWHRCQRGRRPGWRFPRAVR